MPRSFRLLSAFSGCTLMLAGAVAASEQSQPTVEVGTLTCNVTEGSSFIVGSSHTMACDFKSAGGSSEAYTGKINSFGLDIGPVNKGSLVWGVLAPSANVEPGALAGSYGGVSAGAALGAGLQANILVGGLDKSIALQPLSLEANTGLNLTAGITGLQLSKAN
ncbi:MULTISPECIES: DUF992 domain-containing protein [Pseudovibrio]|uniref:DUF992 domain-containing protein n=1 Tax=Stappiaceae TaxID=2821832 RepID=UPI0023658100|nr:MULTISPECIES: DUF992 domain-containing protein [Pseudovibrio]MDD7910239.1 DUF992 domain-containing protein [Pseudovibrio exalbescens]MDX5593952.1 DUF992 domain-containing protein [Pseudovibrio sp. SPO723]